MLGYQQALAGSLGGFGFGGYPPHYLGGFNKPGGLPGDVGVLGGPGFGGGGAPGPSMGGGFSRPGAIGGGNGAAPRGRDYTQGGSPGGFARMGDGPGIRDYRVQLASNMGGGGPLPPISLGGAPNAGGADAGGAAGPGLGRDANGNPVFQGGTSGGGRPIGSPQVPGEMKGIYGGPPMRMPGRPVDAQGRPIYGAANRLAAMMADGFRFGGTDRVYTQAEADSATAWARQALADAYAGGTMGPIERRQYEEYLQRGPGQSAWADFLYDPNQATGGQPGPWDPYAFATNIPGSAAEAQTRAADDYYQRIMQQYDPMYRTPPYVSWGLGETPSQGQLQGAEQDYYGWLQRMFGMSPPPTPLSNYGGFQDPDTSFYGRPPIFTSNL